MGTNQRRRRSVFRQLVYLVILLGALCGAIYYYVTNYDRPQILEASFQLPGGTLTRVFQLEVADTPSRCRKGLMFRRAEELPDGKGMIFIYREQSDKTFWMKDTVAPLDMIFIDQNLKVAGVLHDVPVMNEKPRSIEKPSKYVVELIAGSAKKHGIVEGAKLQAKTKIPQGGCE